MHTKPQSTDRYLLYEHLILGVLIGWYLVHWIYEATWGTRELYALLLLGLIGVACWIRRHLASEVEQEVVLQE